MGNTLADALMAADETEVLTHEQAFSKAINLIESGTIIVDDIITHRLPLVDIVQGFQLVMDGSESIKVIIKPNA